MVVIVCDCCTISLIAIFLCLGYIHFGGKGTHNFSTDKTGGGEHFGGPNNRRKLGFFIQNQLENWRTFAFARTPQASQRCSNVRVVLFLYISLAEILVFSNGSYFFVNIENMEENNNLLIIKDL